MKRASLANWMLERLEDLHCFDEPIRCEEVYNEIRQELLEEIRAAEMKASGRSKALQGAKNILKQAKRSTHNESLWLPNVVDGVQYFCDNVVLVGLNEGHHLPIDPYQPRAETKLMDYEYLMLKSCTDTEVDCDIVDVATQIADLKARGHKKFVYCFGKGDLPVVNALELQYAVDTLGGDVRYFTAGARDMVTITSDSGKGMIAPVVKNDAYSDRGVYPIILKKGM